MKIRKTQGRNLFSNNKGFTLLETMISIMVLSIGVMSVMRIETSAIKTSYKARRVSQTAFLGTDIFEKLMSQDYDQVVPANDADLTVPHLITDGKYSIEYTVSNVNVPIPNTKAITISTWWGHGKNNTRGKKTYVYYKTDLFD